MAGRKRSRMGIYVAAAIQADADLKALKIRRAQVTEQIEQITARFPELLAIVEPDIHAQTDQATED